MIQEKEIQRGFKGRVTHEGPDSGSTEIAKGAEENATYSEADILSVSGSLDGISGWLRSLGSNGDEEVRKKRRRGR